MMLRAACVVSFMISHCQASIEASVDPHPTAQSSFASMLTVKPTNDCQVHSLTSVAGRDQSGRPYALTRTALANANHGSDGVSVELLGLRPATKYDLSVNALLRCLGGLNESASALSVHTSAFAPRVGSSTYPGEGGATWHVVNSNPDKMAPGWTYTSAFPGGNLSYYSGDVIIDDTGAVRWYLTCYDVFSYWWPAALNYACGLTGTHAQLKNGNFVSMWSLDGGMVQRGGVVGLVEVAPNLTVVNFLVTTKQLESKWYNILPQNGTGANRYLDMYIGNHEIQELPNGNWAMIGFETMNVTCPTFHGLVDGNEYVEFDPVTLKIAKRVSMRNALELCSTFNPANPLALDLREHEDRRWEMVRRYGLSAVLSGGVAGLGEWLHVNAFDLSNVFERKNNEAIFSSFATGLVYAIRYEDDANGKAGSLLWALGKPNPAVPGFAAWLDKQPHFRLGANISGVVNRFQASQHDANIVSDDGNQLMLFDNGCRAEMGYPVNSRLMLINLTRPTAAGAAGVGTAEVTWDYFEPMAQKSPFLGGARRLSNGNFLGTFGSGTQPPANNGGQWSSKVCMHAQVVEVTLAGEVVFSASIGGFFNGECYGFNAYRAYRIPVLFANHIDESEPTVVV